jgi:hypothetical protein
MRRTQAGASLAPEIRRTWRQSEESTAFLASLCFRSGVYRLAMSLVLQGWLASPNCAMSYIVNTHNVRVARDKGRFTSRRQPAGTGQFLIERSLAIGKRHVQRDGWQPGS